MLETLIGALIWVIIFCVWYVRTYPDRFKNVISPEKFQMLRWPRKKVVNPAPRVDPSKSKDFKSLVESIELICAMDRFGSSDAATMVEAVKHLILIEPASGQIWEAYALDCLESAGIICDDCRIPVQKNIKKTGIKISCKKCGKWLALKNSKVTVIDPSRQDLEEWER